MTDERRTTPMTDLKPVLSMDEENALTALIVQAFPLEGNERPEHGNYGQRVELFGTMLRAWVPDHHTGRHRPQVESASWIVRDRERHEALLAHATAAVKETEVCAHCGQEVFKNIPDVRVAWMHRHNGSIFCTLPGIDDSSPRATPLLRSGRMSVSHPPLSAAYHVNAAARLQTSHADFEPETDRDLLVSVEGRIERMADVLDEHVSVQAVVESLRSIQDDIAKHLETSHD